MLLAVCAGSPLLPGGNGGFSCGTTTPVGGTCTGSCSIGYAGSPTATCGAGGVWQAVQGTCTQIGELHRSDMFRDTVCSTAWQCLPPAAGDVLAAQSLIVLAHGVGCCIAHCGLWLWSTLWHGCQARSHSLQQPQELRSPCKAGCKARGRWATITGQPCVGTQACNTASH